MSPKSLQGTNRVRNVMMKSTAFACTLLLFVFWENRTFVLVKADIHKTSGESSSKGNNGCIPKQIHLAAGEAGPSTSMTISFATDFECGQSLDVSVLYSEDKSESVPDNVAYARSPPNQYNTSENGNNYISSYFHHITLYDLKPSTTYNYSISSSVVLRSRRLLSKGQLTSEIFSTSSFTTSPSRGDFSPSQPLKFAIVGDLGQTEDSQRTLSNMASVSNLTAILNVGDLAYTYNDQTRWDSWFELIEPLTKRVPMHVTPGNQEIELFKKSKGLNVFGAYERRFKMPSTLPAEILHFKKTNQIKKTCCPHYDYGNSYHAVTYGPVHAIFLNSYTTSSPDSKQFQWLLEKLEAVDRSVTPWLVVIMHCPFYNTFAHHIGEAQQVQMQKSMEPLFIKYQVNMVFAGHVHAYTRTKPVAYGKVQPKAPQYIVIGNGGNQEGHEKNGYTDPDMPEEWVSVRDNSIFGFGLLEVCNATYAKWKLIGTKGHEGAVRNHDEVYIVNEYFLQDK